MSMNGDVTIFLDFTTLALHSINLELGMVEKIADHYEHYLDAILYLLESGCYKFNDINKYLEIDEQIGNEIKAQFQIKSAWI